jgi:hypothetical protein
MSTGKRFPTRGWFDYFAWVMIDVLTLYVMLILLVMSNRFVQ